MSRVFLEEADHPPPSYYEHKETPTRDPKEWVKAPPFVPRSRHLLNAFSLDDPTSSSIDTVIPGPPPPPPPHDDYTPFLATEPPPFPNGPVPFLPNLPPFGMPFPPSLPPGALPFLPQGYSANLANINPGLGPPIPAIVLKKKRRKRNKHSTNSLLIQNTAKQGEEEEEDSSKKEGTTENETVRGKSDETRRSMSFLPGEASLVRGGSCPDLSEDQLRVWENLLYERVMEEKEPPPPAPRTANEAMRTSTYEVMSRPLRELCEQDLDGISSVTVRKIDQEINGNIMSDSLIATRLQEANGNLYHSDACLTKPLSAELDEIAFRPQITKYGYPQYGDNRAHLTTFHYGTGQTGNKIVNSRDLFNDDDEAIEDAIEGFNIRVNAFDEIDDVTLSESDLPMPSRFEQIHWALQSKAANYRRNDANIRPPDRVCCTIM